MSRRRISPIVGKLFEAPYVIAGGCRRGLVLEEPSADVFMLALVTDEGERGPAVTWLGSKMGGWLWYDTAPREWNCAIQLVTVPVGGTR